MIIFILNGLAGNIPIAPVEMKLLSDKKLNELRGKAMVKHITPAEVMQVFDHLTVLEVMLDDADMEDMLGTEGWRKFVGIPE